MIVANTPLGRYEWLLWQITQIGRPWIFLPAAALVLVGLLLLVGRRLDLLREYAFVGLSLAIPFVPPFWAAMAYRWDAAAQVAWASDVPLVLCVAAVGLSAWTA